LHVRLSCLSSERQVGDMLVDAAQFLAVIAILEGGPHPPHAYGPYGISPAVLADVNARCGWSYTADRLADPMVSLQVAAQHLAWLDARLSARGIPRTVAALAGCWRAGLSGWLRGKGRTYGERAAALYRDQSASTRPAPRLLGSDLADAIVARLVRESPSCASCPRDEHVRLVVLAETLQSNRAGALAQRRCVL